MRNSGIYILLLLMFGACMSDPEADRRRDAEREDQRILAHLESQGIEAEKAPQGFYFRAIEQSDTTTREAIQGNVVQMEYDVRRLNGQVIENSFEDSTLFAIFSHDRGNVVPTSLDFAVLKMSEGETYEFWFPSRLAYGGGQVDGLFSANEIIYQKVKLTGVRNRIEQERWENEQLKKYLEVNGITDYETLDNGLIYKVLEEGEGEPREVGISIAVNYKGFFLDGEVFDSNSGRAPFVFSSTSNVIEGWQIIATKLLAKSKNLVLIPSHLAYGASNPMVVPTVAQSRIPPHTPIIFEIEVLPFE
ncbi:MAG: FKBP-type peptidyl-prolyl cis-trans isomerase [Cyclobacteriaceae bacterium]|nr:FKBP-type peptidyl-prolyl cis-trans isomerase [Cyclobacteriaceae bacterium]MCH8515093.1 FKBP-type peptidyl-prolyl cis-trans isomerase [Cyclobacteriaceae bacterium]